MPGLPPYNVTIQRTVYIKTVVWFTESVTHSENLQYLDYNFPWDWYGLPAMGISDTSAFFCLYIIANTHSMYYNPTRSPENKWTGTGLNIDQYYLAPGRLQRLQKTSRGIPNATRSSDIPISIRVYDKYKQNSHPTVFCGDTHRCRTSMVVSEWMSNHIPDICMGVIKYLCHKLNVGYLIGAWQISLEG